MPGLVSIVVTVRNSAATLQGLLDSLRELTWRPLEAVIVDAHSTDGTWEMLEAFQAAASYPVVLARRPGPIGAGRNRGFALARGAFVAVTDADMRVPPDWIERLMAGMGPGIGVVGGPNDSAGTDRMQRCTGVIPVHGPSLGEVPVLGHSRFDRDFETSSDIFAAVTGNCLFRRGAFETAGGFDESLVTTEDGELNRRILDLGYRIAYRREAEVVRVHRASLRAFLRQMRNYARGQAQANRKHRSMRRLRHRLPGSAAVAVLAATAAALAWPVLWWLPVVGLLMVLVGAGCYGVKAVRVRGSPGIAACAALLFFLWQVAWALGYLEGSLGRARGASHAG